MQLLGKIGVIFLLFQIGMEFDFSHLKAKSKTVFGVSVAGILAPVFGGLLIGKWLHTNFAADTNFLGFQMFVCIALSITALPIMGRILLEMKLERTALGAICVSAAAIDDVVGWVGLATITALATSNFDVTKVLIPIGGVIGWFVVLRLVVGPLFKAYWRKVATNGVDASSPNAASVKMPPTFLAVLLIGLFVSCEVTSYLKVFALFGAFMFGVALHEQADLVRAWRDQFSNLVLVALVPDFLHQHRAAHGGRVVEFGAGWTACAAIFFVAAAGKLAGCGVVAKLTGQTTRESISIAALMNTRALMALIAINVGYDLKLLPKELFTMFIIMALLTTAMTGPLLRWCLPHDLYNMVPDFPKRKGARGKSVEVVPASVD